jgi:hypothetical protein
MQGRQSFRRNLREYQYNQGKDERAEKYCRRSAEPLCKYRNHRGGEKIYQVIAEQNQANDAVGSLQQRFGQTRAPITRARLMSQPVPVHAHQCGFGAGEKSRTDQ